MEFKNLSFSVADQKILEDVTFTFSLGRWVWISSEGGVGKSSLLQIMAGLKLSQKGSYSVNSKNVEELSFEEFLPLRLQMGYSFDLGGLIHNRSLIENLKLPLNYHKKKTRAEADLIAMDLLRQFDIQKYKDHKPSDAPGSVRKLVVLLRSLIHLPQILLWDDPTMGLQDETCQKLFSLVKKLQEQGAVTSVFIASQDQKILKHADCEKVQLSGYHLERLSAT